MCYCIMPSPNIPCALVNPFVLVDLNEMVARNCLAGMLETTDISCKMIKIIISKSQNIICNSCHQWHFH